MIHIRFAEVEEGKPQQFYFVINARNGQVLVTSETYTRKNGCKRAINALSKVFGQKTLPITDHTKATK